MILKQLVAARFQIVGVMDGDICPAEDFLTENDASTRSYRVGLLKILQTVAENGLDGVPSAWFHEANKEQQIYEFIKGPFRLFFFKGKGRQIAVCTTAVRKSGQKADAQSVARAAQYRSDYMTAADNNAIEVVSDETE